MLSPNEWKLLGACGGTQDRDFFYSSEGECKADRIRREAQAKSVCYHCPVVELCREYALNTRERYGIWGGLTEKERTRIVKARIRLAHMNAQTH